MSTVYPKVYHGNEPYIFVSYAHKDAPQVLPILRDLAGRGFRLWYDAGIEAATEWPEDIGTHLAHCHCVLAFITAASLDSHNCRREINLAIEMQKELLAVYLEEVHLSYGMRLQLGTLQALYYRRHENDRSFLEALSAARILQACRGQDSEEWDAARREFDAALKEWVVLMGCQLAIGEPFDMPNTQRFLSIAKKLGHGADSICALGDMALNAKDHTSALACYCAAADMGYIPAIKNLGVCYYQGWGVDPDHRKAADYFRYAAEQGNQGAQYFLGLLYESGQGVSQNLVEAIIWFQKAGKTDDVRRCQRKRSE